MFQLFICKIGLLRVPASWGHGRVEHINTWGQVLLRLPRVSCWLSSWTQINRGQSATARDGEGRGGTGLGIGWECFGRKEQRLGRLSRHVLLGYGWEHVGDQGAREITWLEAIGSESRRLWAQSATSAPSGLFLVRLYLPREILRTFWESDNPCHCLFTSSTWPYGIAGMLCVASRWCMPDLPRRGWGEWFPGRNKQRRQRQKFPTRVEVLAESKLFKHQAQCGNDVWDLSITENGRDQSVNRKATGARVSPLLV